LKRLEHDIEAFAQSHGVRSSGGLSLSDIDRPFRLPAGWTWTRLAKLCRVVTDGDHQPPPRSEKGIAFLTIGNLTTGKINFAGCRRVATQYFESLPEHRTPAFGDILYTVVGATFGRPVLVDTDEPFCVQRHVAILKPADGLNVQYLAKLLASPFVYEQAALSTTGAAQPTIALKPLRNFVLPLPPLPEQIRIVAKVDSLLELCDKLEAILSNAETNRPRVAEMLLYGVLAHGALNPGTVRDAHPSHPWRVDEQAQPF